MFLAKSGKGADKMGALLRDREVKKEYVARVKGEFPLGDIVCEEPLLTVAPKVALNRVKPTGKPAKTAFKRISYDGETSIVRCRPFTGRTHQIRVHLQYLGHPIANDPVYSNEWVWGPELGKNGAGDDEAIAERLGHIGRSRPAGTWINPVIEESDFKGEMLTGAKCEVCETDLFSDPSSNDLDLWLHALTYSANDKSWSYATPFPEWALEPNRRYLELALEEAKKCEGTETAFSVGALLVKDGEILSTGYSRELPGNTHAEQCALEKYYEKTGTREVPEGTVIYTTMEPCSERLSGNLPCTDRILDTNIQTVFVGVLEPDTLVANNVGKKKLTDAGVHYIHIPGYEEACLAAATKKP